MSDKKNIKAAVLSVSFIGMGTSAIAAILDNIASEFPMVSIGTIQFLMTFTSFFVIAFSLAAPSIGNRFGQNNTASFGCFLFIVSGILSFLFHKRLELLFLFAAIMGSGIGLSVPFCNGVIAQAFDGDERNAMMGNQASATNIGAMLMTFTGGFLASIHWSYNYLVYLIAIPGLLLSKKYMPHEEKKEKSSSIFHLLKNQKIRYYAILAGTVTLLFNTAPTNLSMLIAEKQFGNSTISGITNAILLASGTVSGILFGRIRKHLGRRIIALGLFSIMVGHIICAKASTFPMLILGCIISGSAISEIMPQLMLDAADNSNGNTSASSSLIMAFGNIGIFASPVITRLATILLKNSLTVSRFVVSSTIAGIVACVILYFLRDH